MLLSLILLWLLIVNAITYASFAADKSRARRGEWRISEARLLFLALIGGWPAAKLAQKRFRHKTRKMPFAWELNRVPLVQVFLIGLSLLVYTAAGRPSFEQIASLFTNDRPATPQPRPMPRRFGPGS